jgi:hypothetical protein
MTRREAIETEMMLTRIVQVLYEHRNPVPAVTRAPGDLRADAESLRRISMTLHRWHELECGIDNGAIERDETTGKPYWRPTNGDSEFQKGRWPVADREAGALKRLAAIMARYPSLTSYVQSDPRGCALYILRPGDVPAGEKAESYYSRGLAVHQ